MSISASGGIESACGLMKDDSRFSWQIIPRAQRMLKRRVVVRQSVAIATSGLWRSERLSGPSFTQIYRSLPKVTNVTVPEKDASHSGKTCWVGIPTSNVSARKNKKAIRLHNGWLG